MMVTQQSEESGRWRLTPERFSSRAKLGRVLAWVFRFCSQDSASMSVQKSK